MPDTDTLTDQDQFADNLLSQGDYEADVDLNALQPSQNGGSSAPSDASQDQVTSPAPKGNAPPKWADVQALPDYQKGTQQQRQNVFSTWIRTMHDFGQANDYKPSTPEQDQINTWGAKQARDLGMASFVDPVSGVVQPINTGQIEDSLVRYGKAVGSFVGSAIQGLSHDSRYLNPGVWMDNILDPITKQLMSQEDYAKMQNERLDITGTSEQLGQSLEEKANSIPANPLYNNTIALKAANFLGNVVPMVASGGIGGTAELAGSMGQEGAEHAQEAGLSPVRQEITRLTDTGVGLALGKLAESVPWLREADAKTSMKQALTQSSGAILLKTLAKNSARDYAAGLVQNVPEQVSLGENPFSTENVKSDLDSALTLGIGGGLLGTAFKGMALHEAKGVVNEQWQDENDARKSLNLEPVSYADYVANRLSESAKGPDTPPPSSSVPPPLPESNPLDDINSRLEKELNESADTDTDSMQATHPVFGEGTYQPKDLLGKRTESDIAPEIQQLSWNGLSTDQVRRLSTDDQGKQEWQYDSASPEEASNANFQKPQLTRETLGNQDALKTNQAETSVAQQVGPATTKEVSNGHDEENENERSKLRAEQQPLLNETELGQRTNGRNAGELGSNGGNNGEQGLPVAQANGQEPSAPAHEGNGRISDEGGSADATAPSSTKVAPAVHIGDQEMPGGKPSIPLYNLTEDIPGHPKGSTVTGETLTRAGYDLPDKAKDAPLRARIMSALGDSAPRQKIVFSTAHDNPGWADPDHPGKIFVNPDVLSEVIKGQDEGHGSPDPSNDYIRKLIGQKSGEEVIHSAQHAVEKEGTVDYAKIHDETSPGEQQKTIEQYGSQSVGEDRQRAMDSIDASKATSPEDAEKRKTRFVQEHARQILQRKSMGETTEDAFKLAKKPELIRYLHALYQKIKAHISSFGASPELKAYLKNIEGVMEDAKKAGQEVPDLSKEHSLASKPSSSQEISTSLYSDHQIKDQNQAKEEIKNRRWKLDSKVGETGTFWRSGKPPESGKSYNSRDNKYESGVSVYYKPYPNSFAGLSDRDWYQVTGKVIESGSDDEPVVDVQKAVKLTSDQISSARIIFQKLHPFPDVRIGDVLKQSGIKDSYTGRDKEMVVTRVEGHSIQGRLPSELDAYMDYHRLSLNHDEGEIEKTGTVDSIDPASYYRTENARRSIDKIKEDRLINIAKSAKPSTMEEKLPEELPSQSKGLWNSVKGLANELRNDIKIVKKYDAWTKLKNTFGADLQKNPQEVRRVVDYVRKSVPDPERRDGITNYLEAGGDESVLRARADATTDKALKDGYEAALKLTPEEKKIADGVRKMYDQYRDLGIKWGVDIGKVDNYVNHIWSEGEDMGKGPSVSSGKRLNPGFKYSKQRKLETYFEGEQLGYNPETKDISGLLGAYVNDLNYAILSRKFIKGLSEGKASDGRPLVAPKFGAVSHLVDEGDTKGPMLVFNGKVRDAHDDYRDTTLPVLSNWTWKGEVDGKSVMGKDRMAIHPEISDQLNNIFGKSGIREWWDSPSGSVAGKLGKGIIKFANTANTKGKTSLFGVLPSLFHPVQILNEAISHRTVSLNGQDYLHEPDLSNPATYDKAAHGLMLAPNENSREQFMQGYNQSRDNIFLAGARKLADLAGDKSLAAKIMDQVGKGVDFQQRWIFETYIPALKSKFYDTVLERNKGRFARELKAGTVTEDDLKYLTARQANNAFGHLNYTDIARNPTVQHLMQFFFLAPDFFEARLRHTGQAAAGLMGGKGGWEQSSALAAMGVGMYITARLVNSWLNNGDTRPDQPFSIVSGNKTYMMRTQVGDLYRLTGVPWENGHFSYRPLFRNWRSWLSGRESPMARFAGEALAGVNYRGEPTTMADAIRDTLAGNFPIALQPALGPLVHELPSSLQDFLVPKTVSNNPISPFEQLLGTLGIQVARYSPITSTYQMASAWKNEHGSEYGITPDKANYPTSAYTPLKYALDDGDYQRAHELYQQLLADKNGNSYRVVTGLRESLDKSFTGGSAKAERAFRDSLDAGDRQTYDAAKARKQLLFQRFQQMKSQFSNK